MPKYGVGLSGRAGVGVTDLGTLRRHAVPEPWMPGEPHGRALCGRIVVLNWIWGQPLVYSTKDSALCPECVQRL